MADVTGTPAGTATTAGVNRYILGEFNSFAAGGSRKVAVSIDLNGGTLTFTFQGRVFTPAGTMPWTNIRATPLSTGTVATGGSATENWQVDADGLEIAVNFSAVTGSPRFAWR